MNVSPSVLGRITGEYNPWTDTVLPVRRAFSYAPDYFLLPSTHDTSYTESCVPSGTLLGFDDLPSCLSWS